MRIDLTNRRFGRLVALVRHGRLRSYATWKCSCDCGNIAIVVSGYLLSGRTQSCGCIRTERLKSQKYALTHGEALHGRESDLWRRWSNIKSRVKSIRPKDAKYYRDRGIVVCPEWESSYESFKKWALNSGFRKELTIDRINNDLGYSPENCRWVTRKAQMHNRRDNR